MRMPSKQTGPPFLSLSHSPAVKNRVGAGGSHFVPLAQAYPESSDVSATLAIVEELATQSACRPRLVIDDTAPHMWHEEDIVFDQNIGAYQLPYQYTPETPLFLGSNYSPLPASFLTRQSWWRRFSPFARLFLVPVGGGNPNNVTGNLLELLRQVEIDGLEAIVVIGPTNPNYEKFESDIGHTSAAIQLLKAGPDRPDLTARPDIPIGTAGSTNWGLAVMGLPTLNIALAANQFRLAHGLNQPAVNVNRDRYADFGVPPVIARLTTACHHVNHREEISH